MIVTCDKCHASYDDAERLTYCPHELLMPREDLERKKLALKIIGKRVKFRHMVDGDPTGMLVRSVAWDGMVELEGMVGEFAPHLFVVVTE